MRARHIIIVILLAALGLLAWLWLTLLSPWTYQRPADLPAPPDGPQQVFVYGTLTHAPVRWLVYGRTGNPTSAQLNDFERHGLDLSHASNARVEGKILDVNAQELMRLDRYERLGVRYERTRVRVADGQQVWVYRRLAR